MDNIIDDNSQNEFYDVARMASFDRILENQERDADLEEPDHMYWINRGFESDKLPSSI